MRLAMSTSAQDLHLLDLYHAQHAEKKGSIRSLQIPQAKTKSFLSAERLIG